MTIYSQSNSLEDFAPFEELGFEVSLDDNVTFVWTQFVHADIVVLSESAFSYTPTVLNEHGIVIQPQYELIPMPDWKVVFAMSDLRQAATLETQEMVQKYCGSS